MWPKTAITIRGDSHDPRPEAMLWCEANDVDYVLALSMNEVLRRDFREAPDAVATTRAVEGLEAVRGFVETEHAAKTCSRKRRVIACIEATGQGLDIRTIVTSMTTSEPDALYSDAYCARGQAENLIKLHKTELKSESTSCSAPEANQMRLFLHTTAYWLMIKVPGTIDPAHMLARAAFNTLCLRLQKIGARIRETAQRVRLGFGAGKTSVRTETRLALLNKAGSAPARDLGLQARLCTEIFLLRLWARSTGTAIWRPIRAGAESRGRSGAVVDVGASGERQWRLAIAQLIDRLTEPSSCKYRRQAAADRTSLLPHCADNSSERRPVRTGRGDRSVNARESMPRGKHNLHISKMACKSVMR